jgi:hypothetical protein
MKLALAMSVLALSVVACSKPDSATTTTTNATGSNDPTNTGINERDRDGSAVTPLDQGGGKDRDITAEIRRNVIADGALGYDAKNAKIVTEGGKVTLRGPVKSAAERSSIEAKARAASGVTAVDNQLEIKP